MSAIPSQSYNFVCCLDVSTRSVVQASIAGAGVYTSMKVMVLEDLAGYTFVFSAELGYVWVSLVSRPIRSQNASHIKYYFLF